MDKSSKLYIRVAGEEIWKLEIATKDWVRMFRKMETFKKCIRLRWNIKEGAIVNRGENDDRSFSQTFITLFQW